MLKPDGPEGPASSLIDWTSCGVGEGTSSLSDLLRLRQEQHSSLHSQPGLQVLNTSCEDEHPAGNVLAC